jgi:hypothetical protein
MLGFLELGEKLSVGKEAALAVLDGDRQRLPDLTTGQERLGRTLNAQRHVAADEGERLVRAQGAREQPCLAEHLEAVADAEHETALGGEVGDPSHRGREAGDRARPQVVAVREASREDDGPRFRELGVGMPDEDWLGAQVLERKGSVTVVVRAGKHDNGDAWPGVLGHASSASSIS